MNTIHIYTDGACSGNPGPGGYGVVLVSGPHRKEISEGFRHTTNNRMELLAVIKGLEALKRPGSQVEIWSDSKYVVDSVQKGWIFNWNRRNFIGKQNADLWKRFLIVYQLHDITFHWLKGHAGHPENERCDTLAVSAYSVPERNTLQPDTEYEKIMFK